MLFDSDTELICFGGVDEIAYKFPVEKGVNMKKIFRFIILFAVCLFLVVWGGALIKNEYNTNKYQDDFKDGWKNVNMLAEPDFFKVLHIDNNYAEVYYVSKDASADILSFKHVNNVWVFDKWVATVWSKHGSASEVIWPYWWHFIYAGF